MKHETLAVLIFVVVAFGGLGYLFVSLTNGVNQSIASGAETDTNKGTAPPAGPIIPKDSPVVLGSPSITTNDARDQVVVNFFECVPGSSSLEFEAGTVSFEMRGIQGSDCVIHYSGGENSVTCRVPSTLGVKRFTLKNDVPNLSSIEDYCSAS